VLSADLPKSAAYRAAEVQLEAAMLAAALKSDAVEEAKAKLSALMKGLDEDELGRLFGRSLGLMIAFSYDPGDEDEDERDAG
jgi:hypothetical protein